MALGQLETVEGFVRGSVHFHLDLRNDVLYLRLAGKMDVEAFGEETDDGLIIMRTEDEEVVGVTVVGYWERFGVGKLEELRLLDVESGVERLAKQVLDAAA